MPVSSVSRTNAASAADVKKKVRSSLEQGIESGDLAKLYDRAQGGHAGASVASDAGPESAAPSKPPVPSSVGSQGRRSSGGAARMKAKQQLVAGQQSGQLGHAINKSTSVSASGAPSRELHLPKEEPVARDRDPRVASQSRSSGSSARSKAKQQLIAGQQNGQLRKSLGHG